ncbi:MAG TPA: acyl-ACP--UDP-N-acetylglucosamine O-acyltransferase [Polyangiaceae bacterium]
MPKIHRSAMIGQGVEFGEDVEVGPYCVIGDRVRIGAETLLHSHVVVTGRTTIGRGNTIHSFAVIGSDPQMKRAHDGIGATSIGDRNELREHVTVHAGTDAGTTVIGNRNMLMAGSHVAHDVVLGSQCVLANAVQLAGHTHVGDHVVFGGLAGLAQHVRVGDGAFVAAGAMCERDVPPFVVVQGDRARVRALNKVGLRRRGVSEEEIAALAKAFRALFVTKENRSAAIAKLERTPLVEQLLSFAAKAPAGT